jgi:hypothetical protein
MDGLVSELYSSIAEFKKINDPFFDNYDYTVFGCFGQFLEDIVQYHDMGMISQINYHSDFNLTKVFKRAELESVISRSFDFIEKKYWEGDVHTQRVINTSFFKIVVTSKMLKKYAVMHLSKDLYNHMISYWKEE